MPLPSRVQDAAVSGGARPAPVLYLHGFASSPESTKAQYFGERLAAHGVPLSTPDFNQPDFTTLTMSRMLDRVLPAAGVFGPHVRAGRSQLLLDPGPVADGVTVPGDRVDQRGERPAVGSRHSSTPGLSTPAGSRVRLTARSASTASGPISAW